MASHLKTIPGESSKRQQQGDTSENAASQASFDAPNKQQQQHAYRFRSKNRTKTDDSTQESHAGITNKKRHDPRDAQYWSATERDPVYFNARLKFVKLIYREFGNAVSYSPMYANALGLSARQAVDVTEFPDAQHAEIRTDDEKELWYVEKILAHRYANVRNPQSIEYLVKWRGWVNGSNTWEPAESVKAPELIVEYFARYGAKPPRGTKVYAVKFNEGGEILEAHSSINVADVVTKK